MNPFLFSLEIIINFILWPIYFIVVCIGYVYDLFACKKVPIPHKILITGASSGIGKATAIEYSKEGNTIVLLGRNKERLREVEDLCKQKGSVVVVIECDIRDKDMMEKLLLAEDDKAPIDLIIASAGVMVPQCGKSQNYAVVTRELFSINVDGTFNTILPLLSRMQNRLSGQIAIVSSGAGLCSQPMNPIYSPTKVTLMSYGETLRFVMREYNVYVSVVSPGAVRTPMTEIPHLAAMSSGLASPEGMAKAIVNGLKRDQMHIGYTTVQYFGMNLIRDVPASAKDYICRAIIPMLKASNQYIIEFYPPPE